MTDFLKEQTTTVTEYTVPLAQRLIEKVTVYDEKMIVRIRYGLEIEVTEQIIKLLYLIP